MLQVVLTLPQLYRICTQLALSTCPPVQPHPPPYLVAARQVSPVSAFLWAYQVLMAQTRPWMPVFRILAAEAMPHWIFRVRGALPIVELRLHRHGRATQSYLLLHGAAHQKSSAHGSMLLCVIRFMVVQALFSQQPTMFICGGVLANWKGEIL